MPVGIGSNRQPNQRLDGILAGAVMGMQTVRAVEIGLGADVAATPGSQAHDVFALEGETWSCARAIAPAASKAA